MAKSKKGKPIVMGIIIITAISMISLGGIFGSPQIQNTRPTPEREAPPITLVCLPPLTEPVQDFQVHLELLLGTEEPIEIPADIGINETCTLEIHTRDTSGTLYVQSADPNKVFTLNDFFSVVQVPFNKTQILNQRADGAHIITMTVNGEPSDAYENLVLAAGQEILIEYVSLLVGEDPVVIPQQDLVENSRETDGEGKTVSENTEEE